MKNVTVDSLLEIVNMEIFNTQSCLFTDDIYYENLKDDITWIKDTINLTESFIYILEQQDKEWRISLKSIIGWLESILPIVDNVLIGISSKNKSLNNEDFELLDSWNSSLNNIKSEACDLIKIIKSTNNKDDLINILLLFCRKWIDCFNNMCEYFNLESHIQINDGNAEKGKLDNKSVSVRDIDKNLDECGVDYECYKRIVGSLRDNYGVIFPVEKYDIIKYYTIRKIYNHLIELIE